MQLLLNASNCIPAYPNCTMTLLRCLKLLHVSPRKL